MYREVKPRSLTVRELREALEDEDDNTVVLLGANYGDYHNTLQALAILETERVTIVPSAYSHSGWAVAENDEDDGSDLDMPTEETVEYFLLTSVHLGN